MLTITHKHKVFLAVEPLDFRNRLDGTLRVCRQQLQLDPMTGHVFVFRNKRMTTIRCIFYDAEGFWLSEKRLSKGKFQYWPQTNYDCCEMTPAQLTALLSNQFSPFDTG